jgi:molybdopterin molybdotransferase
MTDPISLHDARRLIAAAVPHGRDPERVPLLTALGQCLVAEVRSPGDVPATDRSAMDGFAVRCVDCAPAGGAPVTLRVAGESRAGEPHSGELAPGAAVRIMTGATLPPGADAVVRVEDTSGFGGDRVEVRARPAPGDHVRRSGSEVRGGDLLLPAGTRIRAAELGVLAACGLDPVRVHARPRVAVLPTGDEVVEVDATPSAHQVRNSNAVALYGQVLAAGALPVLLPVAPDERAVLAERIELALDACDFLLTIGGVSAGVHDLVRDVLAERGVATVFGRLAVKPGLPTLFGRAERHGRDVFVFGLPGNPASCFTIFELLVRGALARCMGLGPAARAKAPARAALRFSKVRPNARLQAVPCVLRVESAGLVLEQLPPAPSADLYTLARGDAFALVPPGAAPRDGDLVEFETYRDAWGRGS